MSVDCRLCGSQLDPGEGLTIPGFPSVVQYFPKVASDSLEHKTTLYLKRCGYCNLAQLANDPVWYYREVIRSSSVSEDMRIFRIRQFEKFSKDFNLAGKKILEVGCGNGENLEILQDLQFDAYGVEFSSAAVENCLAKGLKVEELFVTSDSTVKHAPFDAFYSFNVLEHLPDPKGWLKTIHDSLAENAFGIIEVPNFELIESNGLITEFMTDHLMYFTEETLERILEISGFKVLRIETQFSGYVISAVVTKLDNSGFQSYLDYQDLALESFNHLKSKMKKNELAIWGAGHQSLAYINLFKLDEIGKFVIDSAPFKQGNFVPGTELPIVSPTALIEDEEIKNVLVIAAGYNDEIVKWIVGAGIKRLKGIYSIEHGIITERSNN
jgi:SAM-dependent methyltransferase